MSAGTHAGLAAIHTREFCNNADSIDLSRARLWSTMIRYSGGEIQRADIFRRK